LLREAITMASVEGVRVPDVFSVNEHQLRITAVDPSPASDSLLRKLGEGLPVFMTCRKRTMDFTATTT
jgi:hypothetical protein